MPRLRPKLIAEFPSFFPTDGKTFSEPISKTRVLVFLSSIFFASFRAFDIESRGHVLSTDRYPVLIRDIIILIKFQCRKVTYDSEGIESPKEKQKKKQNENF